MGIKRNSSFSGIMTSALVIGYADWEWVGVGVAKTRQNISSKLKEKGDYCSHIRLYLHVCDCKSLLLKPV